jgi:hypothetical protein
MSDCLTATNGAVQVRKLQRALYRTSKQEKKKRFYSLYDKIWRVDVLWEAWRQVKGNKGAPQGHSVFECNPDESQRLSWLGCQPAACRRDIRMARPPQQPNRGVAKRCHDLGDTATAHL